MAHSVYWHDGMFFWPHHMQTDLRIRLQQMSRGQKWNAHHNWGVRTIDIDTDVLVDFQLKIDALQVRMRDGTLVDLGEMGVLSALDLKPTLEHSDSVTVLLALPNLQLGRANVVPPSSDAPEDETSEEEETKFQRYSTEELEVEDENTSGNGQPVVLRHLNIRLFTSKERAEGYETISLVRIKRSDSPEGSPEIDKTYIPPVLACDASAILQVDILQACFNHLGERLESIGAEVVSRGINFDTKHLGAARRINQLQILNESCAVLNNLAFVDGVHPFWAYSEMCRIVGKLAILGPGKMVPALPRYDHDDLGGCFYRVKHYLESFLEEVTPPNYVVRPFVGEGLHMQVALEKEWLHQKWKMFVGVRSTLDVQTVVRLLTQSNQLDMKIGSSSRVDRIFDSGDLGLRFTHTTQLPQVLPSESGLIYFQIARDVTRDEWLKAEWEHVQRELTLAIRLNQNHIEGEIQGKQSLTIRTGGNLTTLGLALYLVSEDNI